VVTTSRRNFISIVNDLLQVIESYGGSVNKTWLIYGSRLNFNRASLYLNFLVETGLVTMTDNEDGKKVYNITEEGRNFMKQCKNLIEKSGREREREKQQVQSP
jgi:predicted transcriptional regulator